MARYKILMLLFFAALSGCVDQGYSSCPDLRIELRYRFDVATGDDGGPGGELSEMVGAINFYVFDQSTGVLVRIVEARGEDISRGYIDIDEMEDGLYTFVAWGVGGDENFNHFSDGHWIDAEAGRRVDVSVGVTTIDDFVMLLDYRALPYEIVGDVAPVEEDFDDLYYAIARDVEIVDNVSQTIELKIIRNSNRFIITVPGLDDWRRFMGTRALSPINIYIIGKNGRYAYDNSIDRYAKRVRYESSTMTVTSDDELISDFKTLRIDMERHSGDDDDKVFLHIANSASGESLLEVDIVNALSQVRDPETGELLYDTQEEIDRQYVFPLTVSILFDLRIQVKINDWEIIILDPIVKG